MKPNLLAILVVVTLVPYSWTWYTRRSVEGMAEEQMQALNGTERETKMKKRAMEEMKNEIAEMISRAEMGCDEVESTVDSDQLNSTSSSSSEVEDSDKRANQTKYH